MEERQHRVGKIMIIQENQAGCGESFCSDPDDEGSRPAGTIEFDDSAVGPFTDFQMNHLDIVSGISFARLGGSGGIDNVTASAVPEPSAALLFLVGAVAVRTGIRKSA
jgi:hypothetical protein